MKAVKAKEVRSGPVLTADFLWCVFMEIKTSA